MADLRLTIGTLTSKKTADNTRVKRVLEAVFALFHQGEVDEQGQAIPYDPAAYTDQQKLDYVVQDLIPQMLVDKARQYEEQQAIRQAQEDAAADAPSFE